MIFEIISLKLNKSSNAITAHLVKVKSTDLLSHLSFCFIHVAISFKISAIICSSRSTVNHSEYLDTMLLCGSGVASRVVVET